MHIIFTGGLGNQMFEYAFLLALRSRGHKVVVDTSYYGVVKMHNGYELDRVFGIQERVVNRQGLHIWWLRCLNKFRPRFLYMADKLTFTPSSIEIPGKYIWGYWQDERYFKDIENVVRDIYKFRDIDDYNQAIAQEMANKCSVSLHIRRGDYAEFGMTLMKDEYYQKAVEYVKKKIDNPYFYIFSDDANVAKGIAEKMGICYALVSHNRGNDSYKDMYLMSQCKHNIIANSSFSWWGAWLNENKEKVVVAPRDWDVKKVFFKPQCKKWLLI